MIVITVTCPACKMQSRHNFDPQGMRFTARQQQIIDAAKLGLSSRDIAEALSVNYTTVWRTLRKHALMQADCNE